MLLFQKNRKEKSRVRLPLYVYLSYLLLASFVFTGVSFSKYASTASAQSSARVAAFSVSAEGESTALLELDASDEMKNTDSYSFSVTSNSEVAVKDIVTVALPQTLPDGVNMSMSVNGNLLEPTCSGNTYVYTADFGFGPETHNWTLSFSINPELGLSEEGVLNNITIHVDAEQID